MAVLVVGAVPVVWHFLHDYQRQRVLTFLNPQTDPLGAGYHTIQSQIAIGSGGLFGKGYMNGSQAQLEFLPERSTDFIFAVIGEEWGLVGLFVLLALYLIVIAAGLFIAAQAQDTFTRLIAGGLTLLFAVYVFVNSGMVAGPAARGRRAAAARELRRHVDGDPHGGLRYPDVHPFPTEAGRHVSRSALRPAKPRIAAALICGATRSPPVRRLHSMPSAATSPASSPTCANGMVSRATYSTRCSRRSSRGR
jgi:hypothetical protein